LEKIVQVWFDVPIVERSKLEKVFFAGLDRILETENLVKRFDQNRWANIYFSGMRTYFKTIRDVHRYLSTLSFYAGLFKNKESSEVNPVDLMVIEVLRLFEQKVYSELPTLKRYLTGEDGHGSFGYSRNSDEVKKLIESVIAQAPLETRKTVQELIKQLFPTVEWALGGSSYSPEFTEQWYRELRICHPNVFDRYFQLSIPEGELSQSEIDTILSACGNREQFVKELKRLNENGMLGVALNRLEAYKQEIDLSMALSFTTAIFDIGDELPENQLGFVSTGYDMHAIRLVYWNLKRDTDHKRRVEIIKQAVEQTTGLFLPVMYTSIETDKKEKENDPDSFRIEGDDLLSLIQSCVNKISKASSDGSLLQNSNLGYLLHRWLDWGDENVVKPWARDIISNQDGLLRFLTAFEMRSSSQGSGDVLPKIHYKIHLPSIERFIEISQIAEKVREINTDNLSPEYQRVIQSFLRAVKRRTEGKPDDRWRDDD
jgi:predicted KAP-like P-loop ATPase